MSKRITIPLMIVALLLSGCSSSVTNTKPFKAQAVAEVKPKPIQKDRVWEMPKAIVEQIRLDTKRQILEVALDGVGVPYVFSGVSKSGWDCSGFTSYVYSKFGVKLEHSANKQGHLSRTKHPEIGDIVAFSWGNGSSFDHVGIYAGNNKVVHASSYYHRTVVEPLENLRAVTIVFIRLI
jgi:cell wall-associated NlpC family hydrolase